MFLTPLYNIQPTEQGGLILDSLHCVTLRANQILTPWSMQAVVSGKVHPQGLVLEASHPDDKGQE